MAKGIGEELVLFVLQSLPHMGLLVYAPEEIIVGSNFGVPDEIPADGTGDRLILADSEHALDADVAEEVVIGTGEHGPVSHDVVGLEADVAEGGIGTLALADQRGQLTLFIFLVPFHLLLTSL